MTKKEILMSMGLDSNNPQDIQKFYEQYPTQEAFQMAMGGMVNSYKAQHYAQGGVVDVYQLMGMPTPEMYEMGGYAMMEEYGRGGMIKRKDGSYSKRGLWDNIRANRGSGRKPTKEMLKQERKIRAAEKKEYGGMVDAYGMGGTTNIGDLSHVISMQNHSNMGYAMGGAVNYPEGLQMADGGFATNPLMGGAGMLLGNKMSTFAMGGEPQEKEMTLKEKYQAYLGAKPVAKYTNFPRHPKVGIDPRGTVTGTVDEQGNPVQINTEGSEANWKLGNGDNFITVANNGGKLSTKKALAFYKNRDDIALGALMHNTAEKKAAKEAGVAKYGGPVKGMYAQGGMVPMYGGGAGVTGPRVAPFFNFPDNNYFGNFPDQTPYQMEGNEGWGSPASMTNPVTGFSNYLNTMRQQGIRSNQDVDIPTMARSGFDASGNPVSINPNMASNYVPPGYQGAKEKSPMQGLGGVESYLSYAPAIWNTIQAMRKPSQVPKDLGRVEGASQAPKLTADAAMRAMERQANLGKYNMRQIGGSNAMAGLSNLATNRMAASAGIQENLRNAQGQLDFQAAMQDMSRKFHNAQADMQRYGLQSEADSVPTQYASAAATNLGEIGKERRYREMMQNVYGKRFI